MKTSDIVTYALKQNNKIQRELAECFGISTQAMSLKFKNNSWYVRELCNQVKAITGAVVLVRLPNGEEFEITDELLPKEKEKMEKAAKSRAKSNEITEDDIKSRFTIDEILAMYGKKPEEQEPTPAEDFDVPLTREEIKRMFEDAMAEEGDLL